MARWSEEKQQKARVEILDAARNAFENEGFEGAKLRDIASEAGVAVGTLFNYFPDKLTLLRETLHDDMEGLTQRLISEAGKDAQDLVSLFMDFARPSFAHFCARPALSKVLLRESLFAEGPRAQDYTNQAKLVGDAMVRRLSELKARGGLHPESNPEAITLAFFSHYYFVLMTQLGATDEYVLLRQMSLLANQLQQGVGPK